MESWCTGQSTSLCQAWTRVLSFQDNFKLYRKIISTKSRISVHLINFGKITLQCIKLKKSKKNCSPDTFVCVCVCEREVNDETEGGWCMQVHMQVCAGQQDTHSSISFHSHTLPYLQSQGRLWNLNLRDSANVSGQCGHVVGLSLNPQSWVPAAFTWVK